MFIADNEGDHGSVEKVEVEWWRMIWWSCECEEEDGDEEKMKNLELTNHILWLNQIKNMNVKKLMEKVMTILLWICFSRSGFWEENEGKHRTVWREKKIIYLCWLKICFYRNGLYNIQHSPLFNRKLHKWSLYSIYIVYREKIIKHFL